jgi:hypothetical protein
VIPEGLKSVGSSGYPEQIFFWLSHPLMQNGDSVHFAPTKERISFLPFGCAGVIFARNGAAGLCETTS